MISFPNAKINIGLDILRKRPDGYHDICTVMVPVPWCDILEIVPSKGIDTTLTVTGRRVDCPAEKNLVMKAYRALNDITPLPPLDIHLHKIIPDGAGMGGGSSDAAFTLSTINKLLQLDIPDDTLAQIASSIGADCPFFIYNRPMLATGTGTDLQPIELDLSRFAIQVVKPPILIPTKEAYASLIPAQPCTPLYERIRKPVIYWQQGIINNFEPSIFTKHPAIKAIKQAMIDAGAVYASMTGSGSAVYGLWERDNLADLPSEITRDCTIFSANMQ